MIKKSILLIMPFTLFTCHLCAGKNDDDNSSDDSYEYATDSDSDGYASAESEEDRPVVFDEEKNLAAKKWLDGPDINTPENLALNKAIWQVERSVLRYCSGFDDSKKKLKQAIDQLKPFAEKWPVIVTPIVTAFEEFSNYIWPDYRYFLFKDNRYLDGDLVGLKGQNMAERGMALLMRNLQGGFFHLRPPSDYIAFLAAEYYYDTPESPEQFSGFERFCRSLQLYEQAKTIIATHKDFKYRSACQSYGKRTVACSRTLCRYCRNKQMNCKKTLELFAEIVNLDCIFPWVFKSNRSYYKNNQDDFIYNFRDTVAYFLKMDINRPEVAKPDVFRRNIQKFEEIFPGLSKDRLSQLLMITAPMLIMARSESSFDHWENYHLMIAMFERFFERGGDLSGVSAEVIMNISSLYKSYLGNAKMEKVKGLEVYVSKHPDGVYYRERAYHLLRRALWMHQDMAKLQGNKIETRETLQRIFSLFHSVLDLAKDLGVKFHIFELQQYLDYTDKITLMLEGGQLSACNGRFKTGIGFDSVIYGKYTDYLRPSQQGYLKEYEKLMDDESYQKKRFERAKQEALDPGLRYADKF